MEECLYRVSYEMTEQVYLDANTLAQKHHKIGKLIRLLTRVLGIYVSVSVALVCITGFLHAATGQNTFSLWGILIPLLCVSAVFFWLWEKYIRFCNRLGRKRRYKAYINLCGIRRICSFYEKEIIEETETGSSRIPYTKIVRIVGNQDYVLLLTEKGTFSYMFILPREGQWQKRDESMEKFLLGKCVNAARGFER